MRWAFWRKRDWRTLGQRYAAEHSAWLTRAMKAHAGSPGAPPRIPVRKVSDGGFSGMMSRPGGAERASQWWGAAFDRVDGSR